MKDLGATLGSFIIETINSLPRWIQFLIRTLLALALIILLVVIILIIIQVAIYVLAGAAVDIGPVKINPPGDDSVAEVAPTPVEELPLVGPDMVASETPDESDEEEEETLPTQVPDTPTVLAATATPEMPFYCDELGETFFDDFSDISSRWPVSVSDRTEATYEDEAYQISILVPEIGFRAGPDTTICYREFDLEVDITRVDELEEGYASIQFGRLPDGTSHEVRIYNSSGTRGVQLYYRSQSSTSARSDVKGSSEMRAPGSINHIQLVLVDNILSIYINHEQVYGFSFEDTRWGEINFVGCTCHSDVGGAIYLFDNLSITAY